MRATLLAICVAVLAMCLPGAAGAQQFVFVVRHAEKIDNSADPLLSAAGEARAQRLAEMLSASAVGAIYTTQYRRTVQTAAPLAKRLGIGSNIVPAKETETLLEKIRTHGKTLGNALGTGSAVLVVGHSNTVPAILKGLGHSTDIVIADEAFDDLFAVVVQLAGPPLLMRLKY